MGRLSELLDRLERLVVQATLSDVSRAVRPILMNALNRMSKGDKDGAEELLKRAEEAVVVAVKLKELGIDPEKFIGPDGVDWAKIAWYDETELLAYLCAK